MARLPGAQESNIWKSPLHLRFTHTRISEACQLSLDRLANVLIHMVALLG